MTSSQDGIKTFGSPLYLLIIPVISLGAFLLRDILAKEAETRIFSLVPIAAMVILQAFTIAASFIF